MIKRIFLFLLANIAIIAVISVILSVFDVQPYLTAYGLDYRSLLIYSAVVGFAGSFVSLLLSKWMAKRAYGVQLIESPAHGDEAFVLSTVKKLAEQAGIGMPEVGIYHSPEANAFATGWNKNKALVAVSSGLLDHLDKHEVEAVLAHEIAHVANGDMVTLALIQGVVNTFVIFFARIAAYVVQSFLARDREGGGAIGGMAYYLTAILFEILFGILASIIVMWFSRHREFRADAGSARLMGSPRHMIDALKRLGDMHNLPIDNRSKALAAFKINGEPSRFIALFSSHPPLEKRIAALRSFQG